MSGCTSRSRVYPYLAAALLAAAGGSARAQDAPPPADDAGPIIVGENVGKYNWFDLQWFRAELEFYGEFRNDRQKTQGQPDLVIRDNLLRGTTNISFESYIGHKNLIDLTGSFKLGYEDHTISSSDPNGNAHETPLADFYDVQALILGNSKTPLTIYSRRDETVTAREFASSLRTDTTEHGAILSYDSELIPTRFQYFHREQSQKDPGGALSYDLAQDTFDLQSQLRLTDHQRLEFKYTLDLADETQSSSFDDSYSRQDGTLTHYLNFGDGNQDNLRSSFQFFNRTGRFEESILRLDEQLALYHTDRFDTRYNLNVQDQDRSGNEQRSITGSAIARYRLYDSVVASLTAGGSAFELPGAFDSSSLFTSATVDYTKKVPYGRIDASAAGGFNHQDNSDRGVNVNVIDESYTFNDPNDVVIPRRNVIPGSIQITDLNRLFTYAPGVDYLVFATPGEVRLRRVPTGSILNGQSVLISYQLGPEPGNQIDTFTQTYSLRYTINEGFAEGLSLYTIYQQVNYSLTAPDPSIFVLDETGDLRYGAEYRIGDFFFLVERQNHDSTVSPSDRLRVEGHYDRRLGVGSTISIELDHEQIDYRSLNNRITLDRAIGRWNERLMPGLDLSLYLQYRDQQDDRAGDVQGFEQAVEVHWNFRQTKAFFGFRNSILNGSVTDRTSQTITVGVTRAF